MQTRAVWLQVSNILRKRLTQKTQRRLFLPTRLYCCWHQASAAATHASNRSLQEFDLDPILQYPVAMEIVALASAGILAKFERVLTPSFATSSCILSVTHFHLIAITGKMHPYIQNIFAMCFHIQSMLMLHSAERKLTEFTHIHLET